MSAPSGLRVIAGMHKGRRLAGPAWEGLRPTSDRLRETLFNVLGPSIVEATMLDVCAGTGAVGIEALSRGARQITFVEHDRRAIRLIRQNLAACTTDEGATMCRIVAGDALTARLEPRADLVFLDPPYGVANPDAWLARAASWVTDDGTVIVEHARRDAWPERSAGLLRSRVVTAGDSALSWYRREE